MIETSAHLVDQVLREVPVRQWVLSFPWPLRRLFASNPDALSRCLAVIVRAIQTDLAHRAGFTASSGARTGVVTLIQRFGSALNLNIHLHMLVLDGVYTHEPHGPRFHPVSAPDGQSLERLLGWLVQRIIRRLSRDGLLLEDIDQPQAELGLNLEAADTHVLFNPEDFIARLAALVPGPRVNLTRYHGVFAPSSPFRPHIVPGAVKPPRHKSQADNTTPDQPPTDKNTPIHNTPESLTAPLSWAQRLKRVFNIDITLCPLCGGRLRVIEDVTNPDLIRKILAHIQKQAPPRKPPARANAHSTLQDLFVER